jgi:hypothetical protein
MLGGYNFKEYFKYEGSPELKKNIIPSESAYFCSINKHDKF